MIGALKYKNRLPSASGATGVLNLKRVASLNLFVLSTVTGERAW
jgi:hypothetical protein